MNDTSSIRPLLDLSLHKGENRLGAAMFASGGWRPIETERIGFANGEFLHLAPEGPVPDDIDVLWSGRPETGAAVIDLGLALDCLWRRNPQLRARVIYPYLPYSRSGRVDHRGSLGASVLFRIVDSFPAVAEHLVFELHSPELVGFSSRPLHNLTVEADVIDRVRSATPVDLIVAPDSGRAGSCGLLADGLGVPVEVLLKRRSEHADRATSRPLARPAVDGARVLIFDDELTTGATISGAVETLVRSGAAEVHVLVVRTFAAEPVIKELLALPRLASLATTELSQASHLDIFDRQELPVLRLARTLAQLAGKRT